MFQKNKGLCKEKRTRDLTQESSSQWVKATNTEWIRGWNVLERTSGRKTKSARLINMFVMFCYFGRVSEDRLLLSRQNMAIIKAKK